MRFYRQEDIELAIDTLRKYDVRENSSSCNRAGSIFFEEWAFIYRFIRYFKIKSILEIGSWYHVSSLALLTALSHNGGGKLVSVDLNFPLDMKFEDPNVEWSKIKGSSFNVLPAMDEKFDLLFVDGAHGSDAVEKDTRNSLKLRSDGGFIMAHDINYLPTISGIKRVIDEDDCFIWSSQPDRFHGLLVYPDHTNL